MNLYEVYIVTAILSGAAAAWIAKERGRSPVLWFLTGAVLNVVFLTAIYFSWKKKQQPSVRVGR